MNNFLSTCIPCLKDGNKIKKNKESGPPLEKLKTFQCREPKSLAWESKLRKGQCPLQRALWARLRFKGFILLRWWVIEGFINCVVKFNCEKMPLNALEKNGCGSWVQWGDCGNDPEERWRELNQGSDRKGVEQRSILCSGCSGASEEHPGGFWDFNCSTDFYWLFSVY